MTRPASNTPKRKPKAASKKAAKPAAPKNTKKKAAPAKKGRPSLYTPEVVSTILAKLAEGESLTSICAAEDMPSTVTVFNWLGDEDKKDFLHKYMRAREAQADFMAEEMLTISDDSTRDTYLDAEGFERTNHEVVARSRLRVDTRKWLASKLAPKKYGDKLAVGGAEDLGPIKFKDMTDAERAVRLAKLFTISPDIAKLITPGDE